MSFSNGLGELGLGELGLGEMGLGEMGGHPLTMFTCRRLRCRWVITSVYLYNQKYLTIYTNFALIGRQWSLPNILVQKNLILWRKVQNLSYAKFWVFFFLVHPVIYTFLVKRTVEIKRRTKGDWIKPDQWTYTYIHRPTYIHTYLFICPTNQQNIVHE